jgi:hypothetical protein
MKTLNGKITLWGRKDMELALNNNYCGIKAKLFSKFKKETR